MNEAKYLKNYKKYVDEAERTLKEYGRESLKKRQFRVKGIEDACKSSLLTGQYLGFLDRFFRRRQTKSRLERTQARLQAYNDVLEADANASAFCDDVLANAWKHLKKD